MSSRTSPSPARSSRSPTSTGSIESCSVERIASAAPVAATAPATKPFAPVDGAPATPAANSRAGRPWRAANPACVRFARPYATCTGRKSRSSSSSPLRSSSSSYAAPERGQRRRQLVDRLADGVEQLLARLGVRVGHLSRARAPRAGDAVERRRAVAVAVEVHDEQVEGRLDPVRVAAPNQSAAISSTVATSIDTLSMSGGGGGAAGGRSTRRAAPRPCRRAAARRSPRSCSLGGIVSGGAVPPRGPRYAVSSRYS